MPLTPYYGPEDGITIYHGDALDLRLDFEDAVRVSDPPYNVGYHYDGYHDALTDLEYQELLRRALPPPCVILHYPEDMFVVSLAISELPEKCVAWTYHANTPRQWRMVSWFGLKPDFSLVKQPYKNPRDKRIRLLMANGSDGANVYDWWHEEQVKNVSEEKTGHPCQIPEAVMGKIVGITPAAVIVDPFCGSGTTLMAAKNLGRRAIGIEIEERYCEIAAKRLAQRVLEFK